MLQGLRRDVDRTVRTPRPVATAIAEDRPATPVHGQPLARTHAGMGSHRAVSRGDATTERGRRPEVEFGRHPDEVHVRVQIATRSANEPHVWKPG